MLLAATDIIKSPISSTDLLRAGIIVAVTIVVAFVARKLTVRALRRPVEGGLPVDVGAATFVARLIQVVLLAAGLVYALIALDIRVAPLLGALGIGGIALAFALQDILENFVAGVILQLKRPFRIGDQVMLAEYEGNVEDVGFRSVQMRTFDGFQVFVPARDVLKNPIVNYTAYPERRTEVCVGVAYGTELALARELLLRATASAEGVFAEPAPEAYVTSFGESSIDFTVRFWHNALRRHTWMARDAVAERIWHELCEAGIEIPFPQRVLHTAAASSAD